MNRLLGLIVTVVAVVGITVPVAATQAPIILEFEKAPGGQGYFGLVDGGPGTIEMRIDDGGMRGNTQHFSATLWLTNTSAGTLTAEVSGQINLVTGRAVLSGAVTDGVYAGARVHEESQLVNPATFAFVGTVQIMPAS